MILFFLLLSNGFMYSQSLAGTQWAFVSFDNLQANTVMNVEGKFIASLEFDTDSTYKGNACNDYNGTYTCKKENAFKMRKPSSTKKFCVEMNDLEVKLFSHYPKANRYVIKEDVLYIFTNDSYRLTFKRQ